MSLIPHSLGVLLPLVTLHLEQQVTKFFHVLSPPRDLGITWSIVRFFLEPQY